MNFIMKLGFLIGVFYVSLVCQRGDREGKTVLEREKMKRGRDDEKNVEPMFPRLHVNDTEKGGPRAPPRNKMALYEQLSIPSQRFNSGLSPVNPNNSNNLNPPSSSQGSGHDNSILRRQPPRSVHRADEPTRCDAYLNPSLVQTEPKRGQEEYFTISKFVQSNIGEDPPDNNNSRDKQRLSPFCLFYSDHVVNSQKTGEEGLKQFSTSRINLRQGVNIGSEGNSKELVELRVQSKYSDTNQSSRELSESPSKQFHVSLSFKQREHTPNILHSYINSQDNLQHDYRGDSQLTKTAWGAGLSADRSSSLGNRNSSTYLGNLQQDEQRSPRIPTNDAGSHEDTCRSLETEIMDRGDDVSDTSVVDSMSGTDISPDDVVGMIGQKHFWKARRAIVNQQRVFAVQVFELHRLIKVQKLIAESPHILLEDAYLGKTVNGSPEKKNASDCIVIATREIVKHNDVSEKPVNRIESSAENAVEKTSIPVLEKGNQPPNYGLFSGNPPPLPAITDTYMGSWGFNQPSGHQWLVPVMTPSEGLVYKPYPAPGFMNPAYGPPGSTPIMGNYINYGAPAPQHPYQGVGSGSFVLPPGNGYFPPFGMPIMHPPAMEHMNNLYTQNQASCNGPSQKTADIPKAVKLNPSKYPGVQGSTASSPSERKKSKVVQTTTTTNERRSGALSLFPTSPVDQVPNADGPDQPTQVIKVVPHNARSATQSVARIFRSIQEQRKQFNS